MCATNQANALTLDETFDFQINLVGWNITKFDNLDKARKKDLIENKPEEVKAHTRASGTDVDKCTEKSLILRDPQSLNQLDCGEKMNSKREKRHCHI